MMIRQCFKLLIASLVLTSVCFADDAGIEDVEAEMDTAFSESDAALSEADAAKQRKVEEKRRLEKAKQDAIAQLQKAKNAEAAAKKKIADLERETNVMKKQREIHEAEIKKAQAQIRAAEQRVAAAQARRDKTLAEKTAAQEESRKQKELLAVKNEEVAKMEQEVKDERAALNRAAVELRDLKTKNAAAEKNARRRYQSIEKEKAKIGQERANYKRLADVERFRASVSYKTIALKQDCSMHVEPDMSSKVLNRYKKNQKVSVAKYNSEGWFHVEGSKPGYMHKSCN